MKRFTSLFTSLALAAPLVLGAGIASAQAYPGQRGHHGRHHEEPAPAYEQTRPLPLPVTVQSWRPRLVEKTGIVRSFLFSGRRVRGVMLTDGSAVLLRSANRSLTRRVAPGSLIRVRGFVMPGNATTIRNASIIAVRRAANPPVVYVTPAPAPYYPAPPPATVYVTPVRAPYYPPAPPTVTVTPVASPVYAPAPVPVRVHHPRDRGQRPVRVR